MGVFHIFNDFRLSVDFQAFQPLEIVKLLAVDIDGMRDGIARHDEIHTLTSNNDVAMAGFGRHHLIDTLTLGIGQTDNVAALCELQGVAAVGVLGDTVG